MNRGEGNSLVIKGGSGGKVGQLQDRSVLRLTERNERKRLGDAHAEKRRAMIRPRVTVPGSGGGKQVLV